MMVVGLRFSAVFHCSMSIVVQALEEGLQIKMAPLCSHEAACNYLLLTSCGHWGAACREEEE